MFWFFIFWLFLPLFWWLAYNKGFSFKCSFLDFFVFDLLPFLWVISFIFGHIVLNWIFCQNPNFISEKHVLKVTVLSAISLTDGKNEIAAVVLPSTVTQQPLSMYYNSSVVLLQKNPYFKRNIKDGEKFFLVYHRYRFFGPFFIFPNDVLTDINPKNSTELPFSSIEQ